jgi:hypothetical protein
MPRGLIVVLLVALPVVLGPACAPGETQCDQGCSVFYATDGDLALAGNNEDFLIPLTKVWFVPATSDSFGGVYFGFDNYFAQGGMNDQGLFFDGLALSEAVPVDVEGKEPAPAPPGDLILAGCGTVACVVEMFERYSFGESWSFQLFFGDATGESVIIEPGEIIRQRGGYQVATNFRQSVTPDDEITCPRYLTAVDLLDSMTILSVENMRDVLDAVHVEEGSQTLYSNVYDLTHRLVHVYYFHDYEHSVVFDLTEELAEGAHGYDLPALFPPNPAAEAWAVEPMGRYWQVVDGRRATGDDLPDLAMYEGEYEMPPDWASVGTTAAVSLSDDSLILQFPDASRYQLYPETDAHFFHVGFRGPDPAIIFEVQFDLDEAGRVASMVMQWGSDDVVFPRLASEEATDSSVPPATSTSVPTTSTTSLPTTSTIPGSSTTSTASPLSSESDGESGALWPWLAASAVLVAAGLAWLALRGRSDKR